ncbi:MAG: hypothetical protein AAGE76_00710 [Pseudomonadota bacterium]
MSGYLLKEPGVSVEAKIDWREGYLEPGEYIDGDLGWVVVPARGGDDARVTLQQFDDGASYAWITKGVAGRVYMIAAQALTNTGRVLERALVLRVAA